VSVDSVTNVPMYSHDQLLTARVEAQLGERARIQQELRDVITANARSGNDTILGALLDAIRELAS
jgi:hypothetical protein